MFVSRGLSCHCVLFSFCVYPVCKNGAGHHMYICSLFCLVWLVKSCCQVCAFRSTHFLTADCCPQPHFEAKQVILIEICTVACCTVMAGLYISWAQHVACVAAVSRQLCAVVVSVVGQLLLLVRLLAMSICM